MSTQRVLVVDDERDIRELLTITLTRMNLDVATAVDLADARRLLSEDGFDLCFTDMRLPDGSGQELIELIAAEHADTPVAMITAYGNMDAAVDALKAGAFDCVSKPVDIHVLRQLVHKALQLTPGKPSAPALDDTADKPDDTGALQLVGDSPQMQKVRSTVAKLARTQAPVYLSGESGVGKELVARLMHESGPRAGGPFVPVNCGAIPTELMESELFGHRKGSFTGAHADKEGLFQKADGGTLLLDEIAELPMHMQVKLLRVVQEKSLRPVGARDEVSVDVRFLSATHKDLAQLVAEGTFRQDLYYRVNVIALDIPPLRERQGDVEQLARVILARLATENGTAIADLSTAAMTALGNYAFPGNVRELENILERATAMCDGQLIEVDDLMLPDNDANPAVPEASNGSNGMPDRRTDDQPLDDYISGIERDAIMQALEETRFNKTAAARKLGITFRALRYKLKKLEID